MLFKNTASCCLNFSECWPQKGFQKILEHQGFFVFFFMVRAFSFQRGSGIVELFSHVDLRVSFKKVFCEASQNCFGVSSAITSLCGACGTLVI